MQSEIVSSEQQQVSGSVVASRTVARFVLYKAGQSRIIPAHSGIDVTQSLIAYIHRSSSDGEFARDLSETIAPKSSLAPSTLSP